MTKMQGDNAQKDVEKVLTNKKLKLIIDERLDIAGLELQYQLYGEQEQEQLDDPGQENEAGLQPQEAPTTDGLGGKRGEGEHAPPGTRLDKRDEIGDVEVADRTREQLAGRCYALAAEEDPGYGYEDESEDNGKAIRPTTVGQTAEQRLEGLVHHEPQPVDAAPQHKHPRGTVPKAGYKHGYYII